MCGGGGVKRGNGGNGGTEGYRWSTEGMGGGGYIVVIYKWDYSSSHSLIRSELKERK